MAYVMLDTWCDKLLVEFLLEPETHNMVYTWVY